jgi:hypothetical protein
MHFQQHYEKTAKPLEWTFTRRDLSNLLGKIRQTSNRAAV